MEKSVQITLIIVAGVVLLSLIGFYMISGIMPSNTVTGNGEASLEVQPDLISVYFNIDTTGKTAGEAKDANAEIVDSLITALVKQGFERKQIQTQSYNIYPDYTYTNGQRKDNGYRATHFIKVELDVSNLEDIGKVIDIGVDAGALISYISFELTQESQNKYKAMALTQASEDARNKAEAIASGLNKRLGRVVSTSDSNFGYSPWRIYESVAMDSVGAGMEAKQAVTSIQPSDRLISARVSATYKLR